VGISVQAVVTDHDLPFVGDVGGHPGDELQIVHRLLFNVVLTVVDGPGRKWEAQGNGHSSGSSPRGDAESGFFGDEERLGVEVEMETLGHRMDDPLADDLVVKILSRLGRFPRSGGLA